MSRIKTIGSLFSGIGGLEFGLELAFGASTIWQCEIDKHCLKVLQKHWPNVPKYHDVRSLDADTLSKPDLICAGFPCQDISNLGKRKGLSGSRSSLAYNALDLAIRMKVPYVILENVAEFATRGYRDLCDYLQRHGYKTEGFLIDARFIGASQKRVRLFLLAYDDNQSLRACLESKHEETQSFYIRNWQRTWQAAESRLAREFPGFPSGLDGCPLTDSQFNYTARYRMLGNAVMPQMAYTIGCAIKGLLKWNN